MQAECIISGEASRKARKGGEFFRFAAAAIVGGITVAVLIHGMGRGSRLAPGGRYEHPAFLVGTKDHIDYTFKVTNTTGRPVRIVDRKSSCGCTSAELAKSSLLPGESTDLVVRMDVRNSTTENVAVVTLHTDHPRYPRWIYRIAARSYCPVWFEGPTLDLGEYEQDSLLMLKGSTRVFCVYPKEQTNPPALRWDYLPGARIHLIENTRLDERDGDWRITSYRVDVELDIQKSLTERGYFSEFLTVRAGDFEPGKLQLVARPWRPFVISPVEPHFGPVQAGIVSCVEVRFALQAGHHFASYPLPATALTSWLG